MGHGSSHVFRTIICHLIIRFNMKKSLRICYLTFDSLSEGVGQSQIVPLILGLARLGHQVTVISFEKIDNKQIKNKLESLSVKWLQFPFGSWGIKGVPRRIFLMTRNIPDADVYHCRSDLPALTLVLRRKKQFLWDVRSLWFDQKKVIDGRNYGPLIHMIYQNIEKIVARKAGAVNVLANPLLDVLRKRNGQIPSLQTVIPTSVNLDRFIQKDLTRFQRLVLLSGTLNNFYDIETTNRILEKFFDEGYSTLWARGVESNREELSRLYIETRTFTYDEMPSVIERVSFGIAICRTDCVDVLKGVMPTKVAEFLAVGRPVIVSRGMGDLDQLIEKYKAGIVIQQGMTDREIVSQALKLLEDKDLPKRCRKLAEDHFSMKLAVTKYESIYRDIINRNRD